ncbi:MAG: hypothetical protein FJZ01_22330 [Candidatus Sericytochromatia bacterium]|nr:hypothetical protein [Candidatus Tanganyikabacteria bacterium]
MVVYVKLGQVRWIKGDRVARRPRRKRQRWLLSGLTAEQAAAPLSNLEVSAVARPETCRTHRRIPRLRRSKLIWLPQ